MSKCCAMLGVLGALALPSAAFAAPGPLPPQAQDGCAVAAAHAAPQAATGLAHCGGPA